MISDQELTKYHACAKICGIVLKELVQKITTGELLETKLLNEYGDKRINEECEKIYKRDVKNVAFTTSISLNDCVGNYIYQENNDLYNIIKPGDVIKIQLGVNIGGCIAVLGETIVYKSQDEEKNKEYKRYLDLLDNLGKTIPKIMIPGNVNDDLKMIIESKCTESGCFPVENTTSYQHLEGQLHTDDSKYIITNYQKYYDEDDNLTGPQNLCFEFEPGEVYTINLVIIPNNYEKDDETTHDYKEKHDPHIYRFNDSYYNLKLRMSREFCSLVKGKYDTNAFNCTPFKTNGRSRTGIKECLENYILETYPILYSKERLPIFHKKFTIVVSNNKCTTLKYNL